MFKQQHETLGVVFDRNCLLKTSGDLYVLLYDILGELRHHCRLDVKERRIVQNGSAFELAPDNFSCLDLNGDVVSGLARTLDTINRFDVRKRVMLDKIKIYGLPRAIRYRWDTPFRRAVSF
jgi:hypothetical protein